MSDQSSSVPPLLNKVMSALLRSPIHRMVSRSVMLISFKGRKSGKMYTTPISYLQDGDEIISFTGAPWSRNLAAGAPVTCFIKRREYMGWAEIVDDKEQVADALHRFLRRVRSDARFYGVNFDDDGEPNWADIQRAAQRVVLIRTIIGGQETIRA